MTASISLTRETPLAPIAHESINVILRVCEFIEKSTEKTAFLNNHRG
jgi:hypothetical protein